MSQTKFMMELQELFISEATTGFLAFHQDEHKCHYMNQAAREILEVPIGLGYSDIKLESLFPDRVNARMTPFNLETCGQEGMHQDLFFKKLTGHLCVGSIAVKRQSSSQGPMVLLMIQDQTTQKKLQRELLTKQEEIKQAYDELLDQNKKLKELDQAKNRFIALTTHELRTPMSAILASSEVLTMKLYDNEEQFNEFMQIIWEQANQLSTLINDILDFAKIQAGKMDFYISQQDLSPIIEEIMEASKPLAEPGKINLAYHKPESPALCYFDDVRLKQIITNIVSNAIKYNKDNGSVEVTLRDNGNFFEMHVVDTGVGIDEKDLAKVFNEFETLGKVALHHKGTGLGMPISKRLIEGMGGTIQLTSKVGVGSQFWIQIPKDKVLDESNYRTRNDSFDLLAG